MGNLQFTLNDYILYVFASHKTRLLVEGSDDYRLFNRLIRAFSKTEVDIDIDDASCLIGFESAVSNREKVEMVCDVLKGKSFEDKLTGFVDREYREFTVNPELRDNLNSHKVDGRLAWTRGHSVENYYFDFEILQIPISTLSTTIYHQLALDLFRENFEQIIKTACAASLLGLEIGNYQIIRGNINWQTFDVDKNIIKLNLATFEHTLRTRNVPTTLIARIVSRYPFWEELVNRTDFDIVRWICHGHTGLSFIWSSYKRLVFDVSQKQGCPRPEREVEHALDTKEEIRFNACAQRWIEKTIVNEVAFPLQVLQLLGVAN
jgi:hypothetical protein